MSSLIKQARIATAALRDYPTIGEKHEDFRLQCAVGVISALASRIDRASGSPSFSAGESDALTDMMDAWRVAEPAAVPS